MPQKKRTYLREHDPDTEKPAGAEEFLEDFLTRTSDSQVSPQSELQEISSHSSPAKAVLLPVEAPPVQNVEVPHSTSKDVEKAASLERLGEATQALAEKLAQKEADREAGLDEPRYFWNRKKSTPDQAGNFSMLGTASTMGLHMVSGPIAGGFLGWLIDGWLNCEPIGLGIGILLGLAAGFRNVWADARHLIKGQNSDASAKYSPKNSQSDRKD